ncbi:MAG: competence protein ComEC family protein [Tenacibaculum sp.]|nr:competence protein ComEC family protein [Tenacibaculum sp.]
MKNEIWYIPFHILLCVVLGIYLQETFTIWNLNFTILQVVLAISLTILFFAHRLKKRLLFIFTGSFTYILIGITTYYISNPLNSKNHYTHLNLQNSLIKLEVKEVLKENDYNYRYIARVLQINERSVSGKVILNIAKNKNSTVLKYGSILITKSSFKDISPAKNPYDFDYKRYLKHKGIYHQLHLKEWEFTSTNYETNNPFSFLYNIKTNIQENLKSKFSPDVYSIINSLLLGERKNVSKELLNNYANAGAIHILAISGLHIGILVLLLNYIFSPIILFKHGKTIRLIVMVLILWIFAVFTGLSASVARAVTMFSFMIVGSSIKQKQPVEHSLISSMLILLLIHPQFLFDVGFQLSYLAVFSIVKFQPKLLGIYKPKHYLTKKIWELTTVSFAAQLGVLPLSFYYFHQFPGLFLISNLIIIPFLGIILLSGIIIIILSELFILPQIVIIFYEKIIQFMNISIQWVASKESFIFKNIYISSFEVIFWYLLIISCYQLILHRTTKTIMTVLLVIITFQSFTIFNDWQLNQKREFIVFHNYKNSVIGIRDSDLLDIYSDKDEETMLMENLIRNYSANERLTVKKDTLNNRIMNIDNELILKIDSLGIYPKNFNKNSIIVLKHSPKLNLQRLIQTLNPKIIIADGSNYNSYISRWKETCNELKTPFHSTKQNGAYILNY